MKVIKMVLSFVTPILIVGFILGFIVSFTSHFFNETFFERSQGLFSEGLGAFMGAFFAFLFLRLGEALTKLYERQIKHYNAMVELDFLLNGNLQHIGMNFVRIWNYKRNFRESRDRNIIVENPQELTPIPTRENLLLKLYGKDLINSVFTYFISVGNVNADLLTIKKLYSGVIEKSFTRSDPRIYLEHLPEIEKHILILENFLKELDTQTQDLLAMIRVGLRYKPIFTKFMFLVMRGYGVIKEEDMEEEKKKLKAEIEEVRQKSSREALT